MTNDPLKDYYVLYFQLNENTKVLIEIYTLENLKISEIELKEYKEGINKVNIEKKFVKGTYIIFFNISDKVIKQRVLLD